MIKVLVVDDSSFTRKLLCEILTSDPEIEVIGDASSGQEAVEKVHTLSPDVVTMDIIMPVSDGMWALEEVMRQKPTPVILVSSISQIGSDIVDIAYSLGVVDVVLKPNNPQSISFVGNELIQKIKAVAKIDRDRLLSYSTLIKSPQLARGLYLKASTGVIIGSSAGGLLSLIEVLSALPGDFGAGVIVAQHIPHQFLVLFVERVRTLIPFYIRIAQKGDILFQKGVLFSPGDASISMASTKKGMVANLVTTEHRLQPDIDEVLSSSARTFGKFAIGVILSGMGKDGVKGAEEIKKSGGVVIAEDKSTAGIFGMPRAVSEANLADYVLPSSCIAAVLCDLVDGRRPLITAKEVLLVKGAVVKVCTDFVKEKLGETKLDEIIGLFPSFFSAEIRAGASHRFCAGTFFRELCSCKGIASHAGVLEELGKRIVHTEMTTHNDLVGKSRQLTDCLRVIPGLLAADFKGMTARINGYNGYNKYLVLILNGPAFTDNGFIPIMSLMMPGWIKSLLEKYGAKNITAIGQTKYDHEEKAFIEFHVQWE